MALSMTMQRMQRTINGKERSTIAITYNDDNKSEEWLYQDYDHVQLYRLAECECCKIISMRLIDTYYNMSLGGVAMRLLGS